MKKHSFVLLLLLIASPLCAGPIETIKNVSYYDGADRDAAQHKLDLYLPQGVSRFPTVVFVHGGAWTMGSKDGFLALLGHRAADHGNFFAEKGIAAVHVNYRLSPKVLHPEHIIDVTRSIAWVRRNIAKYGGDVDNIFIMGHSAGGHLVALAASDPKYLQAEGLTPQMIRGVIGVSGVYVLDPTLVTAGPGAAGMPKSPPTMLKSVFGSEAQTHIDASPIAHVAPGLPPFLLAYANRDIPTLPAQAVAMQEALAKKGVSARALLVTPRDHQTVLKSMLEDSDPLGEAVLKFIRTGKPE
jgi:acetyl esterase/lipase